MPFNKARGFIQSSVSHLTTPYFKKSAVHHVVSPAHKLFKRYSAVVALLFFIVSFTPSVSLDSTYAASTDLENFWDSTSTDSTLMTDQEGYLTKMNPQTSNGDRSTVSDYLVHTVSSGETVSTIAAAYKLKSNTLLWANGLNNPNSLKTNQKLLVPPLDGIYHQIQKGETIEKISKTYAVQPDTVIKQNNLVASAPLTIGDNIFLPGAKPIITEIPAAVGRDTPARVAAAGRVNAITKGGAILQNSSEVASGDKPFIFPTHGKITQGFKRGHYAFDIANTSRPAIWVAGAGTVVKVNNACADVSYSCGGGYGNHVIVDHGNGLQTLYAHLTYATVEVGQKVKQGEVLGKMGRSGRVRGLTGIHLHFEVRKNGVKEAPSKYYSTVASK